MISVPATRRLVASLLAGLVASVAAHLATLFIFFVGNGFDSSVLGVANGFFGFSSIFVFILVSAGAYLTEFSRWWLTLLVGAVSALLGAFLGTLVGAAASGTPVGADLMGGVLASLGGVNLSFEVATVLATVLAAPRVHDAWLSSRPARLGGGKVALVRLPGATLDQARTSGEAVLDAERADDQWAAYVDALREGGWSIVEVPVADDQPDSVLVEDAVVVVGDLAILTRSGHEPRRAETDAVESVVRRLGVSVARITEPGALDGGDVLQVGDTVYVGRGPRTDDEGIRQLRELLRPTGRRVVGVPLDGVQHLKTAVTALPDGTVLGAGDAVDPRLFPSYLRVPEAEGAQVAVLGDDTVLVAASATRTIELIRSLGYRVISVDVSEFAKLGAGLTRLSVRIA